MFGLSISDWIAIFFGVISIIVSLYGLNYVRNTKFIFLEKTHKELNDKEIHTVDNDINIYFKKEKIEKIIYFLSGSFIMKGENDIKEDDVFYPLTLNTFDKNGVWKKFNIFKKTDLLKTEININKSVTNIITDLIKKDDYFSFEAIYNAELKGYTISHRIFNAEKKILILSESSIIKYLGNIFKAIFFFFIGVFLLNSEKVDDFILKNDKYETKSTYVYTREDSLNLKTYYYKKLYYVNNKKLINDSIFYKNDNLSKIKNKEYRKRNERLMTKYDSLSTITKNLKKSNYYFKNKLYYSNRRDSLFYIGFYEVETISDSILKNNMKNNLLKENYKYKINDTISVSFNNRNIGPNDFNPQNFIIFISYLCLLLSFIIFFKNIYKFYYLRKLIKIYRN